MDFPPSNHFDKMRGQRLMREYDEVINSIEALIEDAEFQNLHKRLSENTIFDLLGVSMEERIHSRMLGWLLNPSESHGLGVTIIRRFLFKAAQLARFQHLAYGEAGGQLITPLHAETFSFSDLVIHPEYRLKTARRPDLLLTSKDERWLCLIENKILSDEGDEQTTDYYDGVHKEFPPKEFPNRLFIYLSPKGLRPKSRQFLPMSYSAVADLLEINQNLASAFGRTAIDQHIKCLKGQVVEEKQLQDVCWKLYRKYGLAIDKIQLYGGVNILATKTRDSVLESLRDPRLRFQNIEWQPREGKGWMAIYPALWKTGPKYDWPVYYAILPLTAESGSVERITVRIQFDKSDVKEKFKKFLMFKNINQTTINEMLESPVSDCRSVEDLQRTAEKASGELLKIIDTSFDMLDEFLRSDPGSP
jgi:hypothetical protein